MYITSKLYKWYLNYITKYIYIIFSTISTLNNLNDSIYTENTLNFLINIQNIYAKSRNIINI